MRRLLVSFLGCIEYSKALDLQLRMLRLRRQGQIEDTLLLLEHPPVITMGINYRQTNILVSETFLKEKGISVFPSNRGGDVTYHGPGQIVGYPILDLNQHGKDTHLYIRKIEETFIRLLSKEYSIKAGRDPQHPGVWVGDEKITAIGCAIKQWITMHGFAFNINTELDHFRWITPCGIANKGVTSLQKLMGHSFDLSIVNQQVVKHFADVFAVEPAIIDKLTLTRMEE